MMMFEKERQTSIPLHERPDLFDKKELVGLVHMIDFARTNSRLHEQLHQLHSKGPLFDGDVLSKTDRDALLDIGACTKVCVKGEDGFNACSYGGFQLLRIYNWLYGEFASRTPDIDKLARRPARVDFAP